MKRFSFKSKLITAIFFVAALLVAIPAHATVYTFSNSSPQPIIDTYSASWNTNSEVLSLSSTWNNMPGMEIDTISFLISDGGSPWLTVNNGVRTEQFLFYTLDLVANTLLVEEYFGRNDIGTFSGLINMNSSNNGFTLDFDTTLLGLNANSFGNLAYNGAGFGNTVGIWHYLFDDGVRKEAYDIHYGAATATVPEPTTMALMGLGLLGLVSGRKKIIKDI